MAIHTPNSSAGVRNNSSFIFNGGTLTSTRTTASITLANHNVRKGPNLSMVPQTSWTQKVYNAGVFANLEAGQYVIQGYTNRLAGVANTQLNQAGATRGFRGIKALETLNTLKQVTAGWNYSTGAFLSPPDTAVSNFGTDDAARSTRAFPGEWTFHWGANTGPVNNDFPAKTG